MPSAAKRGERFCSRACYQRTLQPNAGRDDGFWLCLTCLQVLPIASFHSNRTGPRPRTSRCIACTNTYHQTWGAKNRRKQRQYQLKNIYGLTGVEVDALAEAQGGKCAGCDREFPSSKRRHVDHCHETKRVRGLLCSNCNMALGLLHDSAETLDRLAAYLRA